ncbi:MAG: DNA gyrase subunit A, partial [Bacilli bacterium]|nr:DNA gyrase subunit A [Bacilli bacterium]
GPDFPTGGIIYRSSGLSDIYRTGRGRIEICSNAEITESKENGKQIIITAIPYQVTKSELVKEIDQIRHNKTIAGIEEVRDETDVNVRIAIDLKDDAKPESILAYLLAKTQMRINYSANIVAIVNGSPKTLNLEEYCDTYIEHQRSVVTRRCEFDLKKDKARLLIVDGLIKANSIINEVVEVIRHSKDKADSKLNLEKKYGFVPEQSEAIVMMPLYKLSHTDIDTLMAEKAALEGDIAELISILEDPKKRDGVIEKDLKRIAKTYGDDRKTSIEDDDKSLRTFNKRDLVKREEVFVVGTRDGYLKRSTLPSWKGSGGQNGVLPGLKAGDTVIFSGQCQTTDFMIFFTSKGNYLFVPVHLLKANKWLEEGQHVNIAISLSPDEKLVSGFAVRHFRDDLFIVMLTRKGQIKRVRLSDFKVARYSRPIRAMKILTDDEVVSVVLTSGNSNLLVFSEDGKAVAYNENELPIATTFSSGSKAAKFKGSECASCLSFYPVEKDIILLLTQYAHYRV